MKRIGLMIVVVLTLVLQACTYRQTAAPEGQPPAQTPAPTQATEEAQTPQTTQTPVPTQSDRPKGKLLVEALPTGVEGLELKDGELRLLDGYEVVEQPKSTFAVMRKRDGQQVGLGGCGCSSLGDCKPVFSPDGIIVCKASGICIGSCGLAVTTGGVNTQLIMY